MPRRAKRPPPRPWDADEDAKLIEICAIGLTSDQWTRAIPTRTFGEIAERRMELKPPLADLL